MTETVDLLKAYNDSKTALEAAIAEKERAFKAYLDSIPEEIRAVLNPPKEEKGKKGKKKTGSKREKGVRVDEDQRKELGKEVEATLKDAPKTGMSMKEITDAIKANISFPFKTTHLARAIKENKKIKTNGEQKAKTKYQLA